MAESHELCGNCHYISISGHGKDDWICRRYPPDGQGLIRVKLSDWCGEWKRGNRYGPPHGPPTGGRG